MWKKIWKKKVLCLLRKYFLSKKQTRGNHIFITATDGIGDNIVRLCILEKFLDKFGSDRCWILCEEKTKDFMKKIGFRNIIVFEKRHRRSILGKLDLLRRIFQLPLQELVSLEFDQHDFPVEFFSDISTTGYENQFHPEMDQYYKRKIKIQEGYVENTVLHFYKEYFHEELSLQESLPNLEKYYGKEEETQGSMTVGVGAGDRYKIMAPSVLSKILKQMIERKHLKEVILLGFGEKEQKYVEELQKYLSFESYGIDSKIGDFSFEESVQAISKSQCYLGMDSGLFHVAASLQKETFGLFTKQNSFSHEFWDNVTVFYGKESEIEDYYGNSILNGMDIEKGELNEGDRT